MEERNRIYTGTVIYREIRFQFVFGQNRLRLIPPEDSLGEIKRWYSLESLNEQIHSSLMKSIFLRVEDPYLSGYCFETNSTLIFFCKDLLLRINDFFNPRFIYVDGIQAYIRLDTSELQVSRIGFESEEINCIYNISRAIESVENEDTYDTSIRLRSPVETRTTRQSFQVDGSNVDVCFDIYRQYSNMNNEQPFVVRSKMLFYFEPTEDYLYIYRLYKLALLFIQYLCYRQNVPFQDISLFGVGKDDKYRNIGELIVLNDLHKETEPGILRRGVYIHYENLQQCECKVLNDLAKDELYTRHIPASYKESKYLNAARAIMITAAFESEYYRSCPEKKPRKRSHEEAYTAVQSKLIELIDCTKGKTKEIYRKLLKNVDSVPLESMILSKLCNYNRVLECSIQMLYKNSPFTYEAKKTAKRLQDMRNAFAHGHLDYVISNDVMYDILVLQHLVYAMQLKKYEISDQKTNLSLLDLFHR